jgi:2-oxoglutarate/2-oxoacid ferredoxin oxidoreductase subunit beta
MVELKHKKTGTVFGAPKNKVFLADYNKDTQSDWCPGCGNFSILSAVKKSLIELNIAPKQAVLVSGVGCYAKLPYWTKVNSFVGLHGRELAVAQGVKLANQELKIICFSGDGAGYGEGGNHFIHACRRDIDLTYVVHNNNVFGLTTGQYSPTSKQGMVSKSSPQGSTEQPLNPLALAIVSGAKFVARAYSGDIKQLTEILKEAISYPGFSFVDIIQECITFNKFDTSQFSELNHNIANKIDALNTTMDNKIKIGIYYKE